MSITKIFYIFLGKLFAEPISIDIGEGLATKAVHLIMLMGALALAPIAIIMVTSFTRFIIVFSFLRSAIGTQQSPPNMVLSGLAIFMTLFVMQPTIEKIYDNAILPLMDSKITEIDAMKNSIAPLRDFMLRNVRDKDIALFSDLAKEKLITKKDVSLKVLVPSFVISELKKSFEMGFLLFLPFLIIDISVAAILMSLGMMMVPPAMIALPFKLIFFVIIDGWEMLCSGLIKSVK